MKASPEPTDVAALFTGGLDRFRDEYYLRVPHQEPGRAAHCRRFGRWETMAALVAAGEVDLMIVRDGALAGPQPSGALPPDEARRRMDEGCTLVVRHAERHHRGLEQLAAAFRQAFQAPVNVHAYASPPAGRGFGWHYDVEEVFLLQVAGGKTVELRRNSLNPWPLAEAFPDDLEYEREVSPIMSCTLDAGDLLYVPAGYWHVARALDAESMTLAVGVMAPPMLRIVDLLRAHLAESLAWRRRLPVPVDRDDVDAPGSQPSYARLLADLADDIAFVLRRPAFVEQVRDEVARPLRRSSAPEPRESETSGSRD